MLGRCIAGKGLNGNMPCFIGLICMGYAGFLTCAAAGITAMTSGDTGGDDEGEGPGDALRRLMWRIDP